MPYAATAMGGTPCRAAEGRRRGDPRARRTRGRELMCGAPAVVTMILDAAAKRAAEGARCPAAGTVRIVVAGAPPPRRVIERVETELGWEFIQIYGLTETSPLLTINRDRVLSGRISIGANGASLSPARAFRRSGSRSSGRRRRDPRALEPRLRGLLGPAGTRPARHWRAAGSTPATGATSTGRTWSSRTARRT
jgi:acyl-CoA synthetase (AMP-forming)/AMP-acid ligase II